MSERPEKEIKQLGRCLKLIRLQHKRTQADLANILSISPQQIQKYELGQNRLPADAILRLAIELQTPVESFFPSGISDRIFDNQYPAGDRALLMQIGVLDAKKRALVKELVSQLGGVEPTAQSYV
ncbi:helix-turn-helix domain-containing protein [Ruegeria sp. EL01]|uniref:helix-turn-helix domain-containing protein n=1 Tax=Ruegeria sp. EL01 TaxID=2107578 RepID=UPI000EA7FD7E|nr:helix-turn-helix transcriptional regulator [Ruegeria sp. EL01]